MPKSKGARARAARRHSVPSIGASVLRLRRERGLTLDEFAQRSGISKSMLSQIERDLTNPTVATLWRLATALDVAINSILQPNPKRHDIKLFPHYGIPGFVSRDGKMRWCILGPVDLAGRFEWYELHAQPKSETVSEPHESGTQEHLTVVEGELVVRSGDSSQKVAAGETARYRADVNHAIQNASDAPSRAFIIVTRG
ncbi:MAG: helix-turn-helix domain-containing protein [Woeseiaceae bacterium]